MNERLQEQLLAVLVMDLGYEEAPLQGVDPPRHQIAWTWAVEGMSVDEVSSHVKEMQAQLLSEPRRGIERLFSPDELKELEELTEQQ